jgi:hypothetical protein
MYTRSRSRHLLSFLAFVPSVRARGRMTLRQISTQSHPMGHEGRPEILEEV